jgi:hypothetical protein
LRTQLAQKEDKVHFDVENLPAKRQDSDVLIMENYEIELKRAISLSIVSRYFILIFGTLIS